MIEVMQRKDLPDSLIDNVLFGVFGNSAGVDYYRFDFAYLFHDGNSKPEGFIFFKEVTNDTIYADYGGTFPTERGFSTFRNLKEMYALLSEKYKTLITHVQNTNFPMLKVYLHEKFEIIGVRVNNDGKIYCELKKDLRG